MNIIKKIDGTSLTVKVSGRLDTSTAPELDAEVKGAIAGVTDFTFDFEGLEYLSSAGLRVLLSTQKTMNAQGKMVVKNVNDSIKEVFEITGFNEILTIE